MAFLSIPILILGIVLMVFGSIWLLFEAFKSSVLWGLAVIFIPFAQLIYVITHWEESARPLGLSLLGVLVFGGGFLISNLS